MTEVLFLTVHKAASSFFAARFLPRLARNTGLTHLNPEGEAWRNDRPGGEIDVHATRTDCVLGPVRVPSSIREVELFDAWRKILLVRDPRDVLTSYYFSTAYSHPRPEGEVLAARFDEMRAKARAESIDEFVLRMAPVVGARFEDYRRRFAPRPGLLLVRYEDVILDWQGFADQFMAFTGLSARPAWTTRMRRFAEDFSVAEESPEAHKRQIKAGDHRRKLSTQTLSVLDEQLAPILEWLQLEPSATAAE